MGFIFLLFIGFIILIICLSKKTNEVLKHYGPVYYDYDDIEDEIMFHEMMDENDFTDRQNIKETYYSDLADDYNDYYEEVYDSAMGGDQACIDEIREEFGDDWEREY